MTRRHPIKVVSRRTGLSPHLIRMWERRYGAVEPERTDTNRRMYSDEDINRLMLLKRATEAGESIGQIAQLPSEDLAQMAMHADSNGSSAPAPETNEAVAEHHLRHALEAVRQFDVNGLEKRLLDASVTLGQQQLLDNVLRPLLQRIGEMWSEGEIKPAHEHLASAVVRSLLGSMVTAVRVDDNAPRFIATTPTGQFHEFGALMAAVTAASAGWRVSYLGPNLPAEDIAAAARQSNAPVVALSIVYPPDDPNLVQELKKLRHLIDDDTLILIGGRAAERYEQVIDGTKMMLMANLPDLKARLDALRQTERKPTTNQQPPENSHAAGE